MDDKLDSFSFGFDEGIEKHNIYGVKNVVWHNGKVCVALLYEDNRYALDFGNEINSRKDEDKMFSLKKREWFEEFDPLMFRCIAMQWVTHGGNINHD
jgi:hypothetical protein